MAMESDKGKTPAVRCFIHNRKLILSGHSVNVPSSIVCDPEYAAGYFYDNPSRPGIYVPTVGGGTVYLSHLLQEMDIIDRIIIKS